MGLHCSSSRENSPTRQTITTAILLLMVAALPLFGQIRPVEMKSIGTTKVSTTDRADLNRARSGFAEQQPVFIENRGQWASSARYLLRSPALDLWITGSGMVYDMKRIDRVDESGRWISRAPVLISFENASPRAAAIGSRRLAEYHNYFIGNDRSKWAERVPLYCDVRLNALYKGIDAVFYLDEGRPRYDLVVAANADPSVIRMRIEGASSVRIGKRGVLEIATPLGTVEQRELMAYQEQCGRRIPIPCAFVVASDGTVRFNIGRYDRSRPLVIDPIIYSTYHGGSGSDIAYGIAVDDTNNAYVAGQTESMNFPVINAFRSSAPDTHNGFVTKFNSSGGRVYSTYLGGNHETAAIAIAVDDTGNAYVTGLTKATTFPMANACQSSNSGFFSQEVFVTKFTSAGGSLAYSTYLGGWTGSEAGTAIAVDGAGNAYVTGFTKSTDFPTLNAYQSTCAGSFDAFVAKFSSNGACSYSTYLGGSAAENAYDINYNLDGFGGGIAVDGNGNAYITGITLSDDFPTLSAQQSSRAGGADVFVTKLTSACSLASSTYLGGSDNDEGRGIGIDGSGNVYVAGRTRSSNFPITSGASQTSHAGSFDDAFVTKLASDFTRSYSTYLGGSDNDLAEDITADDAGNAYVTGYTRSSDFPSLNATYSNKGTASDPFVTKLSSSGARTYSAIIGNNGLDDAAYGIDCDASGNAYIAGRTNSGNHPTENAAQASYGGGNTDAFVMKLTGDASISLTSPNGAETWCAGTTQSITWSSTGITNVRIELSSNGGSSYGVTIVSSTAASGGSYSWAIPANQSSSSTYRVRVSDASNPSVNVASSADFTINSVTSISSPPASLTRCTGESATLSVSASGSALTYQWKKDGSDITGATSSTYSIASVTTGDAGSYTVAVSGSCGSTTSDGATLTVNTGPTVSTEPQTNEPVCPGTSVTFTAAASGTPTPTIQWQVSDDDGATYGDIEGETSGSLIVATPTLAMDGNLYRAVFTNTCAGVASAAASLRVEDNNGPVPDVAMLPDVSGECSATIATAPTATDDCRGVIVGTTTDPLTYVVQGSYVVHWTYDDGNGNTSTQDQTVVVDDVTAPVPDASLSTNTGQCSVTVTAPTATDDCVGSVTATTGDPTTYSAQGTYTVRWIYADGNGNSTSQDQTVIVLDDTSPTITAPSNLTANADAGSCSATIASLGSPTTSDNCSTVSYTNDHSASLYPVGTTTVTWTATDAAGNTETAVQTVTVVDNQAPSLTLTSDTVMWSPNHDYRTFYVADMVTGISENCGTLSASDAEIWKVTSDEVEESSGNGDGDTYDDIIIASDCNSVQLRRERDGTLNGRVYRVYIRLTDENGNRSSDEAYFRVSVPHSSSSTATDDDAVNYQETCGGSSKPTITAATGAYLLLGNHPNPFSSVTSIAYVVPKPALISIEVYDARGNVVATIVDADKTAGHHAVEFDGSNLPSGTYAYVLKANGTVLARTMVLVR